ncbi:probable alpha,alpha-trehalose-phosphate synthase [UDP-forming] 11 [Neltuma alba]|uniref:probable alpha,alpha-trehalose-phosphate synthase [UDP-forming] 11 n=1 Tax=Neltuma alba TaxID=207710 RepID=UPI0010A59CCF|nr:probable alpha,alpha-trehalose-phosphate synthase [UDP-forming] 11 [Prosopis alba]XP_028791038.1 probable alpha,alpha-trehalose-phosphate synthase [UDP-forming] 11 [Prosopis alba]
MLSRSCLDLLSLVSVDDYRALCQIPRVSTVPGVVSKFDAAEDDHADAGSGSDEVVSSGSPERRIIVANQLPIRAYRDVNTKKWSFEFDSDSLVLQLKDGLPSDVDVLYVGSLKVEIDPSEQDEVAQVLLEKFQCVPTFLPSEIHNKYYHGFCKHYLWPLFHYMVPMSTSQGARFDRSQWQAYVLANRIFANKVTEVINPDEDYVWVHDYHLMILPTLLRKRFHRVKLGFFMHNTFPSSEIYRTIPVRDDLLRALLNCDLIGFHTFDYARHFLSCCSRIFGLDYESKRGYIGLDYYGRTVMIKILPAGIHMGQLESVFSLSETAEKIKELKKRFEGKFVILGMDDMDLFKGINLKFLAMGKLLDMHEDLRGRVVLVQILNPARSEGKDIQDVQNETNAIAKDVNEKYGETGYQPIIVINGPVSTLEKAAYCAISECCIVNAVRDGMNLVPYMYTVCRQGSPVLDRALDEDDNDSETPKQSVIVVSEFIGCSPSLSGAIRVNPWNIDEVSEAMNLAITMPEAEKHLRHEKHYKYISSHDVTYWARSFDQDLERACRQHYLKRYWGVGLGLGFRIVALDPTFRKLSVDNIASAYRNTHNRLILLDYDGTMLPQPSIDKTPTNEVISILNCLCSDPKNMVFIVSGRDKKCLSKWFSPCEKLGLSAEHGYFTRWSSDSSWETCGLTMDFDWKRIAEPVMALYTEATDGSFIEQKESALVWHHQEADPHFGSSQAKELLDHLESVLANEPVIVKRGQHIVEVNPQGVSKGIAVESLISSMRSEGKSLDFLLCIGDDRSDEDMFESIASTVSNPNLPTIEHVFACTVGQKPSMAEYYLDDTCEVIKLLKGLANATSASPPSRPLYSLEDSQGSP